MKTLTATISFAMILALTGTSAYSQDRMSKAEALERGFNRMADLFDRSSQQDSYQERNHQMHREQEFRRKIQEDTRRTIRNALMYERTNRRL